jgi:hypothetical protein
VEASVRIVDKTHLTGAGLVAALYAASYAALAALQPVGECWFFAPESETLSCQAFPWLEGAILLVVIPVAVMWLRRQDGHLLLVLPVAVSVVFAQGFLGDTAVAHVGLLGASLLLGVWVFLSALAGIVVGKAVAHAFRKPAPAAQPSQG